MKGEVWELRTDAELSSSGAAVARAEDGRVVFVRGAGPSERVAVRITKAKKRFLEAEVERILEPGPDRTNPQCSLFEVCGGCVTQHVSYSAQLRSKQRALVDALERIGKLSLDRVQIDAPWSGEEYGYRTRARFAVAEDGTLGYRARGGASVVRVTDCPVLSPALNAFLRRAHDHVRPRPGISEITVVEAAGRVLASGDSAPADAESGPVEVLDAQGPLWLAADVFAQSNAAGNEALLAHVAELLGSLPRVDTAVELYAGSGNITRLLAPRAERVIAVEGTPASVALGRRLLPGVDWRADSTEAACGALARELDGPVDLVVVDPPRTGCEPETVAWIGAHATSLVYVSCGPSTFARDAGRLSELGLGLQRARLFDFYPQTEHAEIVALFRRA